MQNRGFSLIEMMVVVAIVSIVALVALPSFSGLIGGTSVSSQTNDFVASLSLARSEAVKRSAAVAVCPSSDGAACSADGSWSNGWIVYVVTGATVLQAHPALSSGSSLAEAGDAASVTFLPGGQAQAGVSFNLCKDSNGTIQSRNIQVSLVGRVRSINPGTCN